MQRRSSRPNPNRPREARLSRWQAGFFVCFGLLLAKSCLSANDPIADILSLQQIGLMRAVLIAVVILASCSDGESIDGKPVRCGETFCAPELANLIPEGHLVDFDRRGEFNTFQMEWRGSNFEIYEGDFRDLHHGEEEQISIPIASSASFFIDAGTGRINAHLGDNSPRFVVISGPCASRSSCAALDAAKALRLR